MERLVLLVIAVIGLHTAFVLYMANVRVDQEAAKVRRGPVAKPVAPAAVKPALETELATIPSATAEDSPVAPGTRHDQSRSKTRRISSHARLEAGDRRHPRLPQASKPFRAAFALPESNPGKTSFDDRVILYRAPSRPPVRSFTPSLAIDEPAPKPKKNSLLAKLQVVYKKPWGLIKAIGSKLH